MRSAVPPSEIRSTQGRFVTLNSVVSVRPGVNGIRSDFEPSGSVTTIFSIGLTADGLPPRRITRVRHARTRREHQRAIPALCRWLRSKAIASLATSMTTVEQVSG